MQSRAGTFPVWDDRDEHFVVCYWQRRNADQRPLVEFTISTPNAGPQGTQESPLIDGIVTLSREEWQTLGMIDDWQPRTLLYKALEACFKKGREELRGS